MSKRSTQTLILMVDNEFGVLTRVTSLVRREGWNIKSLVVAETLDPAISRLTISVECLESTLPHVLERLGRLACVRTIAAYAEASHIRRELVMITVSGGGSAGAEAEALRHGAHILESSGSSVTMELSGTPEQAEELINALQPYGMVNVARSGAVTLERPVKE